MNLIAAILAFLWLAGISFYLIDKHWIQRPESDPEPFNWQTDEALVSLMETEERLGKEVMEWQ